MFLPSVFKDWTNSVPQKNAKKKIIKNKVFKKATKKETAKGFKELLPSFSDKSPGKKPAKSLGIMHIIKVPNGFIEKSVVPNGSSPKAWAKLVRPKTKPKMRPTSAPKRQAPTATGIVMSWIESPKVLR